jgi:hypothetical protein
VLRLTLYFTHFLSQTKAVVSGTAAQFGELRELGLGSFSTPVGLIQNMVEICR